MTTNISDYKTFGHQLNWSLDQSYYFRKLCRETIVQSIVHSESWLACCNRFCNSVYTLCSYTSHFYSRPCGLMDKAPDFGSGDCRFESCHGRFILQSTLKRKLCFGNRNWPWQYLATQYYTYALMPLNRWMLLYSWINFNHLFVW